MAVVAAFTAGGDADEQVVLTADVVAGLMGVELRQIPLPGPAVPRKAAATALRALREPDVLLAVLASDQPSHSFWQHVAGASPKPVIVVPSAACGRPPGIHRVLVPLDGTPQAAAAVAEAVRQFVKAGVGLIALHVFDESTVPMFWDQPAHATPAWSEEFLARNVEPSGVRLELRRGLAGEHVVEVASEEHADLIALAWSRQLDPDRARTVKHTVLTAGVPVLLVPVAAA